MKPHVNAVKLTTALNRFVPELRLELARDAVLCRHEGRLEGGDGAAPLRLRVGVVLHRVERP